MVVVVGRRWRCPQVAKPTAAIDGFDVLQTSHRFCQRLATDNQFGVRSSDHILEACGAATASCSGSNMRGRHSSCLVVLAPLRLLLGVKLVVTTTSSRPLIIIPAGWGSLLVSPLPLLILLTADGCRCLWEYDSGSLPLVRRPSCRCLSIGH